MTEIKDASLITSEVVHKLDDNNIEIKLTNTIAPFSLDKLIKTTEKTIRGILSDPKFDNALIIMAALKKQMKSIQSGKKFRFMMCGQHITLYKSDKEANLADDVLTFKRFNACLVYWAIETGKSGIVSPMAESCGLGEHKDKSETSTFMWRVYMLSTAGSELLFEYYPYEVAAVTCFRSHQIEMDMEKGSSFDKRKLEKQQLILWENVARRRAGGNSVLDIMKKEGEDAKDMRDAIRMLIEITKKTKKSAKDAATLLESSRALIHKLRDMGGIAAGTKTSSTSLELDEGDIEWKKKLNSRI